MKKLNLAEWLFLLYGQSSAELLLKGFQAFAEAFQKGVGLEGVKRFTQGSTGAHSDASSEVLNVEGVVVVDHDTQNFSALSKDEIAFARIEFCGAGRRVKSHHANVFIISIIINEIRLAIVGGVY